MFVFDLATEQERQLTTGKRAERTKRDFRCPICLSAIYQASCLILRAPSSTDDPGLLLNQPRRNRSCQQNIVFILPLFWLVWPDLGLFGLV